MSVHCTFLDTFIRLPTYPATYTREFAHPTHSLTHSRAFSQLRGGCAYGRFDGALLWESFRVLGVIPVSFGFLVRPLRPSSTVLRRRGAPVVEFADHVGDADVVGISHTTKRVLVAGACVRSTLTATMCSCCMRAQRSGVKSTRAHTHARDATTYVMQSPFFSPLAGLPSLAPAGGNKLGSVLMMLHVRKSSVVNTPQQLSANTRRLTTDTVQATSNKQRM